MISGIPVVVRVSGASNEATAAHSAELSINAGKALWRLTLVELVERCIFAEQRHVGFFVIDSRGMVAHRQDTNSGEEPAQIAMIQAAAELEADGYGRLEFSPLGTSPACAWEIRREAGTLLNHSIVAPNVGALAPIETALLSALLPSLPKQTFPALLAHFIANVDTGTLKHWVGIASQRSQKFTVWLANAGSSTLPDFTEPVLGDALLDAAWGFTATLMP